MVGITALWMPIVVSAVFVFIALAIIHGMLGWHKRDMTALPGEARVMETLRSLNVRPGEYRFPYGNTVAEMEAPEFVEKMNQGPVGVMSISPSGEIDMGKLMGQWFVYSLIVAAITAYITGQSRRPGAPFLDVLRLSGSVAFCCYVVAHWQNWIWWSKGARFTLTYSVDGFIYAAITGATFGWLWPR
jgi:hypothetical protein